MQTIYARKENTNDKVAIAFGITNKKDVVLYADRDCTTAIGRYHWYLTNKPSKSRKTIMHNCYRYALEWV